jgi:hypothetical protein
LTFPRPGQYPTFSPTKKPRPSPGRKGGLVGADLIDGQGGASIFLVEHIGGLAEQGEVVADLYLGAASGKY